MATAGAPFNLATRTMGAKKKSPLENALPSVAKAAAPTNFSGQINNQFDMAQSKLSGQKAEAGRSALENAQRAGAIRGTTGAGFETKIQEKAVAEATKPYGELSTGLETERSGQLTQAGQARDALKEQQRQFNFGANLQRFVTGNEAKWNPFLQSVNALTALRGSDVTAPSLMNNLMDSIKQQYASAR